jgi:hypothetical protein
MFCERAMAICPNGVPPDCASECENARVNHPACNALVDSFLQCALGSDLVCSPDRGLQWPSCTEISNALSNCLNPTTPPPPPPPVRDAGPVPVCGTVPNPTPMACTGGSSGGSTTTTGGGASCMSECIDNQHNTWMADCTGNACGCWFNGVEYCQCTLGNRACYQGGCCPM